MQVFLRTFHGLKDQQEIEGTVFYARSCMRCGCRNIEQLDKRTREQDGSGQSRYNLLSPEKFTRLLYAMHHNQSLSKIFYGIMPIANEVGGLGQYIHAKTGTLKGVSSLSGYITTRQNKLLVFSILINHIIGKHTAAKRFEAELCSILS